MDIFTLEISFFSFRRKQEQTYSRLLWTVRSEMGGRRRRVLFCCWMWGGRRVQTRRWAGGTLQQRALVKELKTWYIFNCWCFYKLRFLCEILSRKNYISRHEKKNKWWKIRFANNRGGEEWKNSELKRSLRVHRHSTGRVWCAQEEIERINNQPKNFHLMSFDDDPAKASNVQPKVMCCSKFNFQVSPVAGHKKAHMLMSRKCDCPARNVPLPQGRSL